MGYWVQLIYILAVADGMGFVMLAILFGRMKGKFGWMLSLLFATSAVINITGTMAIAATMPEHFTKFTLSYGLSCGVRIIAQFISILKLLGFFEDEHSENPE